MQSPNKTRRLGLLLIGLLVIGVGLILAQRSSKKNSTATEYLDPYSHQVVSSPRGKTPDTYGTPSDRPLYLGFDKLIDHGMSFNQVNNLEVAFYQYSKIKAIKEVSIDVDHVTTKYDPSDPSGNFLIFFKVMFNRKDINQAKVEYSGLDGVRLYLTEPGSGKLIFDSGTIGSPNS
jgi:hypothetical protein